MFVALLIKSLGSNVTAYIAFWLIFFIREVWMWDRL
jgi:hypothetical protein